MQVVMPSIPLRDALHFLGWRGTSVDPEVKKQIEDMMTAACSELEPHAVVRRFALEDGGMLAGTRLIPEGNDVRSMLATCREAVLLAATLGAASERMLLRAQAKDAAQAAILDAVLSAAIEAVCDAQEDALRKSCAEQGLFLTDRFSPGYGDMPMKQTREICAVLDAQRSIGLTVSHSGLMIPRKSVTAIMGICDTPIARRPSSCAACSMRDTCALARKTIQRS